MGKPPAKYLPLQRHLAAVVGDTVTLTFAEVEALLGAALPSSARQRAAWWANTAGSFQARAWLVAGWRVQGLNRFAGTVRFVRERPPGGGPGQHVPKYEPLRRYLLTVPSGTVTLSFAEVAALVGSGLPASAELRGWWYQAGPHRRAWEAAGWRLVRVDRSQQRVTFVRVSSESTS